MLLRAFCFSLLLFPVLSLSSQNKDSLVFKTYFYDGGQKSSEGNLRDGKPDGYWKSYYRNGKIKAEGNRKDFLLSGLWVFNDDEGNKILEINYKEGIKEGLRKTFKNGVLVKKENFVKDKLEGFTEVFYPDGSLYKEIPFVNNKENGTGYIYDKTDGRIINLLTYKDGVLTKEQAVNSLDKQLQKQGMWVTFFPSRVLQIEGPYVNNLKHGYWKYYRSNGNLLRVEKWVMGVLQENAKETFQIEIKRTLNPNSGKLAFKGAYRNGIPEGVHRKYNDEGEVIFSEVYENGIRLYEGIIDEQGRKQGPWIMYYKDGTVKAKGSYKDNLKIGNWIYFYKDGNVEQTGNYISGLPDGTWVWRYKNGQVWRQEEYVMGDEEGMSVEYSDTGFVIAQGKYVEGKKDGEWLYTVNDHQEKGSYFDGLRQGKWKHYYLSNNALKFEGFYEGGVKNGLHIDYYDNGKVKKRGKYAGNEKEGIWEYFYEDGTLIISIEYENGKEIKYNGEKIKYGRGFKPEEEMETSEN